MAGVAPDDVWAVGSSTVETNHGHFVTLTARWDGTAWTVVKSPNRGSHDNELYAVAAVASDDVWAVGISWYRALVEHWDGNRWHVVPVPRAGRYEQLIDVAVAGPRDVWAVGATIDSTEGDAPARPLVEHWDGVEWSSVPAPAPSRRAGLEHVTGLPDGRLWALGWQGSSYDAPFIARWNGSALTGQGEAQLTSFWTTSAEIAATKDGAVWLVAGAGGPPQHTFTERCEA